MRRNVKFLFATISVIVCLFFLYNLILLGEIVEDQPDVHAPKPRVRRKPDLSETHDDIIHIPKPHKEKKYDIIPPDDDGVTQKVPVEDPLPNLSKYNTSILILTHDREKYLEKVLNSLMKLPHITSIKNVIVSQDGNVNKVRNMIESFQKTSKIPLLRQQHQQGGKKGVFAIAQHYGWALGEAFEKHNSEFLIILEDDIVPSPDFLEYFDQLSPFLLDPEEKVWCVSSWNDLGFKHLDLDPSRVYRTQFFPGLGWMMHRKVWMEEFKFTWPNQAWDYYMRTSHIHKHRDCICPELPRNTNIGVTGATVKGSGTYDRLLSKIAFQSKDKKISLDLEHISYKKYEKYIRDLIETGLILPLNTILNERLISSNSDKPAIIIPFEYRSGLEKIIRSLGISYHNEERTHHEHVMIIPYKKNLKVVLINAKLSKFIPSDIAIKPPDSFQVIAAEKPNESCNLVCQKNQLVCKEYNFDYIMNCDILKEFFPCENGCMIEIGKEIPSYVVNSKDMNYKKCILLTQDQPKCSAVHRNTQRLCPCQ